MNFLIISSLLTLEVNYQSLIRKKKTKIPTPFPPSVWNVHEIISIDGQRTNNQTEVWNHCFFKLVW